MRRADLPRVGDPSRVAVFALGLLLLGVATTLGAQAVPGENVSVTGGPALLTLDPFEIVGNPWRNQEVESHCAVDTRNPSVLVCSAVDYRLVDLPGGADGVHNDSWNMFAQSIDGGLTWVSRLVPGHPLDPAPNVLSEYDFAADPIVQAGAAGLFLHAGLVAKRKEPKPGNGPPNAPGAIYVSTWINLNDQEDDLEPVKLVENGISLPATGNSGQFRDRPHLAVGEPSGGTCTLQVRRGDETVTQTIPATPAYLGFTTFVGGGNNVKTQIHFMKSDDCGQSWSNMINVSQATASINVGVQIVTFPGSSRILLFWRRGANGKDTDAIMVARSDDGGKKFTKQQVFSEICPFDQDTSPTTFRVTTVPSAVADANRAYVVWADRRDPTTGQCTSGNGTLDDARIVLATTPDGATKTGPFAVDAHSGRGHQVFPTLSSAAGRVHVAWLDFRNDASGVFQEFIDEQPIVDNDPNVLPPGIRQRHTADMFSAEAGASSSPEFDPSQQISQYIHGIPDESSELEPLQWNVVNARNFDRMNVVFFGDYNSVAAESIVPKDPVNQPGVWATNGSPGSPPLTAVFHRSWTDGRNLSLSSDEDYTQPRPFTPPDLNTALVEEALPPESLFDSTQVRPVCDPDSTGTKNLDIYTSRSTHGFYAFAPWNNKAMLTVEGDSVQRAFVIVVQNTNPPPSQPPAESTTFRLTIVNQPLGNPSDGVPERASFEQFSVDPAGNTIPPNPVDEEQVVIRAGSAIARTVYVTSSDARAAVRVDVDKLGPTGDVVATRAVFLNPDRTAPPNLQRPGNVDPMAPEFDIERFEVHGLEISNFGDPNNIQDIGLGGGIPNQGAEDGFADWGTPRWQNPRWQNPRWQNPRWQNPRWQNPRWQNPRWQNPRWQNFTVSDDDAENGSRHIRTQYTNTGNTTSAYDARVVVNTVGADRAFQLVVYKLYTATPMEGCDAAQVGYTQVLVNVPDYDVSFANLADPSTDSETTFSLHPGETAFVELIVHPTAANPDVTTFDPEATPPVFVGTPLAVDTVDVVPGAPVPLPAPVFSQLFVVPSSLPNGTVGQTYPATSLEALGGEPPLTWTIVAGSLPPGLSLDPFTGVISGLPTTTGSFGFTARAEDSAASPRFATEVFTIDVATGFVGPYEMQNWMQSGISGGTTSITPASGPTSSADFGYNVFLGNPASGVTLRSTTFSVVAAGTGQVSFDWEYTFFHSFFQVEADFRTFAGSSSGTTTNTELDFSNLLFTGPQTFTGSATMNVEAGFAFGFEIGGSNFDSNSTLNGTLTISNFTAPSFGVTGSMGAARLQHTATLLPDGKVLVAGGVTSGGAVLASAELHDPASGNFTTTAPMTTARELHAATLLPGGKVLITGGFDGLSTLASADLYDPTTGSFALTGVMSSARSNHTATLLSNGKVLVAGGSDSPATAELYDPATGTFSSTGSMNAPRADHTATLLPDGKVLISGSGLGGVLATAELYHPDTGAFSTTGSMGAARLDHTATLLPNGKVLVAGGFNGSSTLAGAELYNPTAGTFAPTAISMSTTHRLHTATLLPNGNVLIAGGANGSGVVAGVELYDPAVDSFSPAGSMGSARQSHTATLLFDGRVLLTGGGGAAPLASAELYHPDASGGPLTIVADGPLAVFGSPAQVVRVFTDRSLFTAALAGSSTLEENFDSITTGTTVTTIFPGVLDVSSTFDRLEVFSGGVLFGFDGTTRIAGNGRYDLRFVPPPAHGNLGFDIASQDPRTLPAQVEVRTSAGNVIFLVSNISGSESIPTFVGLIASLPIESVVIREGPEVTGTGNEEVALDNFIIVIP